MYTPPAIRGRTVAIQIRCRCHRFPRTANPATGAASNGQHPIDFREGHRIDRYRPPVEGLYARIERWTDEKSGIANWRSISRDNVASSARAQRRASQIRSTHAASSSGSSRKAPTAKATPSGNIIRRRIQYSVDPRRLCERHRRFSNQYLKRKLYGNEVRDDEISFFFEAVFDYREHVDNQSSETAKSFGLRPAIVGLP
jgi:hypothetical protein